MSEQMPSGKDRLWEWFGLSSASWLTMPRVLMHAMPDEWQGKMAALLREYDEAFPSQPDLGTRVQVTDLNGKLVRTPEWLINYRHPDGWHIDEVRGLHPKCEAHKRWPCKECGTSHFDGCRCKVCQ